ncbi:serine/arginine repetitive matrix protein 2-like [Watersipora subatra]|uniref:serine/arginine repetitive matrix protein 2-like n=1 Tax=Watersipora subatra TaxID=2589382 RepID=UPI00355C1F0E
MDSESDVTGVGTHQALIFTEYGADLQQLANSFSSDVINEAISEIVAEEDVKDADEGKWYRQRLELTPTLETEERMRSDSKSSMSKSTSSSTLSQRESSGSLEKVSPIHSSRSVSQYISRESSNKYADEPETSSLLKDVPGYVSPNTRQKMLDDAGFGLEATRKAASEVHSSSDESGPLTTMICDNMQDTVHEEVISARKNSLGSFSSGVDDKSSVSNPGKQRSDGSSSVGSTTAYYSIASGVFGHKKHLSPLLDMSGRSGQVLQSPDSSKSSPRERSCSKSHESPRDLQSQLSSVTEYETLPYERTNCQQSANNSAHLLLSPDLAQRVSDILNQTGAPPITKHTFATSSNESSDPSATSSPRDGVDVKSRMSTDSSLTQDELDKRVTHVLNQSTEALRTGLSPKQQPSIEHAAEDHSYLDKYMSPNSASFEKFTSRPSPPQRSKVYVSPSGLSLQSSSADRAALSLSGARPDSELSSAQSDGGGINTKYMDKSSREVLEQAAEEYYRTFPKSTTFAGGQSKNDTTKLSNASELSEELAHLVDTSTSPRGPEISSPVCKTVYDRPAIVPSPRISQADTQSLVAKRLDRIEFMVLSALNEVPPQSRPSFVPPAEYEEKRTCGYEDVTPLNGSIFDSNDVIKKANVRSPLTGLPDYSLEQPRVSRSKAREESFNVSISPVRREPFTAFNRAQDLLAERLNQRSNERTPGRRLSTRSSVSASGISPSRSPTGDHSYLRSKSKPDVSYKDRTSRAAGLENIPEPLPLEITEAGRSPPEDITQCRKSKGRSHSITSLESATTVESSHPESDDAQPPLLPKEAFGTRKETKKSTPGIYGTKTSNGKSFDSIVAPRANSAIGRAEKALLRGEELRDQIQARRDERAKRLDSSALGKEETKCSISSETIRAESFTHEKSRERTRDGLEESVETVDHSSNRLADRDVPFDFYTPPRVSPKESRWQRGSSAAAQDDRKAEYSRKASRLPEACEEKEVLIQERTERVRGSSPLERSPPRVSLTRSRSVSPKSSPASSPTRHSPQLDSSRAKASIRRESPQYQPGRRGERRVRPLERVDDQLSGSLRSKLSHAVNDRLTTYHILREELLRAEDEVKGRDLNLAWQRISKRKPTAASELDESCTTATSTVSSEMFDEQRMAKLKSLLKNPLGHLVSKAKEDSSGWRANKKLSSVAAKAGSTAKTDSTKYNKLMLKIQEQREQTSESNLSISTTTLNSSDETFCSRCDAKRSMKRAKKLKEQKSQGSADGKSDSCSTRPVTPTGLPIPTIKSCSREVINSGQAGPLKGLKETRLKDVGVMFPSPDPPNVVKRGKQKRNKELPRKQCLETPAVKEGITWFNNEKRDCDKRENAFQKARSLERGQDGLVWFVPFNNPRPWSKSPKERHALAVSAEPWPAGNRAVQTASQKRDVMEICDTFDKATGRTGYVPTLQEAFRERNHKFISHSRERQRLINLRAEERQITKVHDEQRARLFDIQPQNYRSATHKKQDSASCPRRAIPKEEMYDRTDRNYRVLPEVRNRVKEGVIQRERTAYRLKAKIFNKKVQRHVLERARLTNLVGQRKSAQMRS